MTDGKRGSSQVEQWISIGATIAAPISVLGALLFYFGYVSSASEYAYFGVNVDTIGLSTQDYIMRSPQTLLVPLVVLALASAGFLALNSAVRRRIAAGPARAADDPGRPVRRIRRLAPLWRIPGLVALAAGVVLLVAYSYVRDWELYGLVTPLLIGAGAGMTAYASRILQLISRQQGRPVTAADTGHGVLARRTAMVLLGVVVATSVFWATATVAQWSGRGLAEYAALHFDTLPSVVLDSKERLFLSGDRGVRETVLPHSAGQTFRYRYRGLHLLIEGHDRMFLVPDTWSLADSTLIVPLDGSVRVQFQFENEIP